MSELRAVLGDTPHDSRIIRTIYKTGYSFCANVSCTPSTNAATATIELIWKKHSLALTDGEHIAGRDAEGSLVVDGTTVSRCHARIVNEPRKT